MLVSPVKSSMPDATSASADGKTNPTPTFMTLVVFTTPTWSMGDGRWEPIVHARSGLLYDGAEPTHHRTLVRPDNIDA